MELPEFKNAFTSSIVRCLYSFPSMESGLFGLLISVAGSKSAQSTINTGIFITFSDFNSHSLKPTF